MIIHTLVMCMDYSALPTQALGETINLISDIIWLWICKFECFILNICEWYKNWNWKTNNKANENYQHNNNNSQNNIEPNMSEKE